MMHFKNEAAFRSYLGKQVEACGGMCIPMVVGGLPSKVDPLVWQAYSPKGLPDRYVCHRLWRGWIETKFKSGQLMKHQQQFLEQLMTRGENAFVIRYEEDLSRTDTPSHLVLE